LLLESLRVVPIVLSAAFGLYHRQETMRLQHEIEQLEQEVANLRRTEEILHTNEAPYRGVVASLPVALFALDTEGVFTLSEGKRLDALGLEPDKVVGRSIFETYRDAPQITEDVRLALAGKSFSSIVEVNDLTFEMRYSPLRVDGKFTGVLGITTDITERREAEQALEESERRLSTLLSNAPAYLYRCRNHPEWPNEYVSDYAFELTGLHPEGVDRRERDVCRRHSGGGQGQDLGRGAGGSSRAPPLRGALLATS
jgi:PAS domain S-box-containing protein